jgi:hypothetical protein
VYEMICIHQIPGQAVSIVGARWMRKQRGSEEYRSTVVPKCRSAEVPECREYGSVENTSKREKRGRARARPRKGSQFVSTSVLRYSRTTVLLLYVNCDTIPSGVPSVANPPGNSRSM